MQGGKEITELFEPHDLVDGDYSMHDDYDPEDEYDQIEGDDRPGAAEGGETDDEGEEESSGRKPKGGTDSQDNPPDSSDDSGAAGEGGNEGGFDSSRITKHMGETGEKIEKAKDLAKDAKDVGELVATGGADVKAWLDLAKRHKEDLKKAAKRNLEGISIAAIIVGAVALTPIMLISMALMGTGPDGSNVAIALPSEGSTIVEIAERELAVGACEDPLGSNCGDGVDKYTMGACEFWCADFVSYVLKEAGKPFTGGLNGGWRLPAVSSVKTWFENNNKYIPKGSAPPQPGDIVIYKQGSSSHVNIVTKVEGNKITTIGGNEGNCVREDWCDIVTGGGAPRCQNLTGFGRP